MDPYTLPELVHELCGAQPPEHKGSLQHVHILQSRGISTCQHDGAHNNDRHPSTFTIIEQVRPAAAADAAASI